MSASIQNRLGGTPPTSTVRNGLTRDATGVAVLSVAAMSRPRGQTASQTYGRQMKQVTFASNSLLMGNDAADMLMEYARLIADSSRADSVTLSGISHEGDTVVASFLLNGSVSLMTESLNSAAEPPDNIAAMKDLQSRIDAISRPPRAYAHPTASWGHDVDYDSEGEH